MDPDSAVFSQPTSGLGLTVEVWMRPDVLIFPGQTADPYIHWLGKGMPAQFEWAMRTRRAAKVRERIFRMH